jgi:hypothetical protein
MSRSAPPKTVPREGNRRSIALIASLSVLSGFLALVHIAAGHSGWVDGYGCHRAPDKVSYHCHEGQFMGRTFKSKEDFLRRLRQGKSEELTPRGNTAQPPAPQKKIED